MNMATPLKIRGFEVFQELLSRSAQEELVADIRSIAEAAPMFAPVTPAPAPWTTPTSNGLLRRISSAGQGLKTGMCRCWSPRW